MSNTIFVCLLYRCISWMQKLSDRCAPAFSGEFACAQNPNSPGIRHYQQSNTMHTPPDFNSSFTCIYVWTQLMSVNVFDSRTCAVLCALRAYLWPQVIGRVRSHCKLGVTATLLRGDDKIEHLNYLIGRSKSGSVSAKILQSGESKVTTHSLTYSPPGC